MDGNGRRRAALCVAAVAVVAAGLSVHEAVDGWAGAFAGDALYAVLMVTLVAVACPRLGRVWTATVGFGVCAAVELLQSTGLPAAVSARIPGAELVLGSTFQWTDLLAYAIGAAIAGAVDELVVRRAAGSSRGGRRTPSAGAPVRRPPAGRPSR